MNRSHRLLIAGCAGSVALLAVAMLTTPSFHDTSPVATTIVPSPESRATAPAATASMAVASAPMGPLRRHEDAHHTQRPGLLVELAKKRGRPLTTADRQAVHDALRDTVEEWRTTQAEFVEEAATLLRTTPDVIDQTLPRKGWARIGAIREASWTGRLEQALGRRLTSDEHQRLGRIEDEKHARIWSARERASQRIAHALGMSATEVDSAWPWPSNDRPAVPHPLPTPSEPS